MTQRRWLVSAAHKSSGKTMVSIGLAAALQKRGLSVQTFKKGPDYIDPMWLSLASNRPCFNLDPHLSEFDAIRATFAQRSEGADIALIEGNKGLFDGMSLDGHDCSAALGHALATPVILVIDTRGITRGIAPLLLGMQAFDPSIQFAGVILNRTGGSRHEGKLRQAVETFTSMRVLGAIGNDDHLGIPEATLGLVPSNEVDGVVHAVARLAKAVAQGVDLDRLLADPAPAPIPAPATSVPASSTSVPAASTMSVVASAAATVMHKAGQMPGHQSPEPHRPKVRIAIARDRAFGFYYPDDLDALVSAGAQLLPFDSLRDQQLPDADALFIGGGFPERHAGALEANASLRADIRRRIAAGLPTYAECGGLMLLCRAMHCRGQRFEMVGAIGADVVLEHRPVGRGYVRLAPLAPSWLTDGVTGEIGAHEFHYSRLVDVDPDLQFAWRMLRGQGVDGGRDGIISGNLVASYAHLRSGAGSDWPARFVAFAAAVRAGSPSALSSTP